MLNQSRPHVDDISTKRSILGSVAAGFQMIDGFFSPFPLCGSSAHSAHLGTYLGPFPLQGLIAFRPIDLQQMKTQRYVLGFDGLGPVGAGSHITQSPNYLQSAGPAVDRDDHIYRRRPGTYYMSYKSTSSCRLPGTFPTFRHTTSTLTFDGGIVRGIRDAVTREQWKELEMK